MSVHATPGRRLSVLLALILLAGLLGILPAPAPADAQGSPPEVEQAVLFAADGLRQDLVERYARQGALPEMAGLMSTGAKANGGGSQPQAPTNTGAGWYTVATGAWSGVHGSTNNTFHQNGDPFAGTRTTAFEPGSALRGDHRPVRRAGWQEGRADRVGGWSPPPSSTVPPSTSAPSSPAAGWSPTTSHRPTTPASWRPSGSSSTIPTGSPTSPPSPRRRRHPPRVDQCARIAQPADGSADAGARLRHRQVRTQRLHLRLHRRRCHQLRPGALRSRKGRRRRRRRPRRGRVGRRQGDRHRWLTGGQDRRLPGEGGDPQPRPLPGAAVPHLGDQGERHMAHVARRARLHRVRRVPRRRVPDGDRRRLRRPRGRHRQRGHLRRAGPVLGDRAPLP